MVYLDSIGAIRKDNPIMFIEDTEPLTPVELEELRERELEYRILQAERHEDALEANYRKGW